MKPSSPKAEKDFSKDLTTFDKLPARTKELVVLKDQAEKATGRERVAIQRKIENQARPRTSRRTGSPK